jgi:adenosylmethionine-8-amino-7-oxononanoate aminotransferase
VLDLFEREAVLAANERKAARFFRLAQPLAHHRNVRAFRHLGMIWAFEVEGADAGFAQRAFEMALARGVLLRPIGRTVYFLPPYVIGEAEFAQLVDAGIEVADRLGGAA